MVAHSPRAFPWEKHLPWAPATVRESTAASARGRRPRPRICLRKGCGRKYQPRRWNQRYCQDPECRREVRRWQAARRQARHRQDADAKARHAQAEKARRQRAKSTSQTVENPEVTPARGHAAENFFPLRYAIGRAATNHPVSSLRNPARYCGPACRQAVRNVQDRERKWLSRGTLDGRKKRAIEYQAARRRRVLRQGHIPNPAPSRPPPQ